MPPRAVSGRSARDRSPACEGRGARDAGILAVGWGERRERRVHNVHSLDAGCPQPLGGESLRIEPGRADDLKRSGSPDPPTDWSPRTSTSRDSGARSRGRACWATASPRGARSRRSTCATPSRRRNDRESRVQCEHVVRQPQQLAQGHPMAHRDGRNPTKSARVAGCSRTLPCTRRRPAGRGGRARSRACRAARRLASGGPPSKRRCSSGRRCPAGR